MVISLLEAEMISLPLLASIKMLDNMEKLVLDPVIVSAAARTSSKASLATENFILCSDFININEPQDLIVASLYRIGEVSNDSSKIKIAKRLREKFLLNK